MEAVGRRLCVVVVVFAVIAVFNVGEAIAQRVGTPTAEYRDAQREENSTTRWDVKCPSGRIFDAYKVWDGVRYDRGAIDFLQENYRALGGVTSLAEWLACQNFKVNIISADFYSVPPIWEEFEISIMSYFAIKDGKML